MKYTLNLILLFFCLLAKGQSFNVVGTIKNENNEPIELVNVYVSGSTIGTATNSKGQFKLIGIKPGQYDLIISHINYDVAYLPLAVNDKSVDIGTVNLKETAYDLITVEVNQKQDKKWNKHFKQFKTFLLGEHYKSKRISIPDSYNADFTVEDKMIKESYPFQ